jgi:hypothetical protein
LDLAVLARARDGLQDVRLMQGSNQVPYLLETTLVPKRFEIVPVAYPDPTRPRTSRWRLDLPFSRLPVQHLAAVSSSPLFDRTFTLHADWPEPSDRSRQFLGQAAWRQTPNEPRIPLTLPIVSLPETATLWLETDNGDNTPVTLDRVELACPDSRLYFRAEREGELHLYYGNPEANAPRYDLNLVAGSVLAAEKTRVGPGPEERLQATSWRQPLASDSRQNPLIVGVIAAAAMSLLAVVVHVLRSESGTTSGET